MRKTLIALMSATFMVFAFGGCEAEDESSTDVPQACTYTATSVANGCDQFRYTYCDKLVACGVYGTQTECYTWFDSDEFIGGCDPTFTDPVASQTAFSSCLCGIDVEGCADLSSTDVFVLLPVCYDWIPAQ
jgi:hypothetical protein